MVAIALESRTSTVPAASPLTSSFLPKCTHLLQAQLLHRPVMRLSFHGVAASTKQKKKGLSSAAREWSYEHLMVVWDEVFEQCCTDSVMASKIRDLSCRGLSKHGRGCVLVFQEVQTRPRGSGTGFTSKPPKSSRRVPDFVILDWYAVYLPREFLLDPRKAPNEPEMVPQDDEASSADAAQVDGTCKEPTDDATGRLDTQREDITIDVEEIIRSAQDVYQFGSDDDDDDDVNELDACADEANFNNDSLLILDDQEDATPANRIKSLRNLDDEDNIISTAASISNDVHEDPLVVFDDGECVVAIPPKVETQSRKEIIPDGGDLNSAYVGSQDNFGPAVEMAHSTSIEAGEEHNEYHGIDATHSTKERSKMQFNIDGGAAAFVNASGFDDGAGGKDGSVDGARSAAGVNEAYGYTVEILEDSEVDASSLKRSAVNENASMDDQGTQDQGDGQSTDDLELATQQMLFTAMRGMDRTRLMSLTANFDFEAKTFRFGRKMAMIDMKTTDAGGEDPYNPNEDELVLLLHLVIDGRPTYGADIVVAYKDETQTVGRAKSAWKLRAKYKI